MVFIQTSKGPVPFDWNFAGVEASGKHAIIKFHDGTAFLVTESQYVVCKRLLAALMGK